MSADIEEESRAGSGPVLLFGGVIFLGAFLLFQVQPLIARYILPWFGGSESVWSTSMMFFQVALLIGYGYAHLIVTRVPIRRQAAVHVALAGLAALILPIIPSAALQPGGSENPTFAIVLLLAVTVGPPYLVLAATGPLMQAWFGRVRPGKSPYRLYAVSNAASLLGLLSYPLLVERYLTLRSQAWIWSGGYIAFAVLTAAIARRVYSPQDGRRAARAGSKDLDRDGRSVERTDRPIRLLWFALPGTAVVVFLAVTNQMTLEVAQIPLLWIIPLSMYLISFIVVFARPSWYRRGVSSVLLVIAMTLVVRTLVYDTGTLTSQVITYSVGVFFISMSLHGELVRLTPPTSRLTEFYLSIAAGGALGGAAVALVAPRIFPGLWELHLGLVATAVLMGVSWRREVRARASSPEEPVSPRGRAGRIIARAVPVAGWAALLGGSALMGFLLVRNIVTSADETFAVERSFYGVLRVSYDYPGYPPLDSLMLSNGPIVHGFQYVSADRVDWPTSYYSPKSGVGIAIEELRNEPDDGEAERNLSIGVVGLGTGTLAAYAGEGDSVLFYEIDPAVVSLCRRWFTYLDRAEQRGAAVDVLLGDARLVMERQIREADPPRFDVLAIDAFSGDAIPVHLLTREAFEDYWRLLPPDGTLAVHTSNRHVDLAPVVRRLAELNGKEAVLIEGPGDDGIGAYSSDWILVTSNSRLLASDAITDAMTEWPADARSPLLWTDDYSNLLAVLY